MSPYVELLMPLYFYTALRRASAPPAGLLGKKGVWRVLNVKTNLIVFLGTGQI
jgi:hypothetical protein